MTAEPTIIGRAAQLVMLRSHHARYADPCHQGTFSRSTPSSWEVFANRQHAPGPRFFLPCGSAKGKDCVELKALMAGIDC